jgi:prepilin-type N-terminal cleavage/methylation domain-containing protein
MKTRRQAFTLIELLVVIAIIGILAGLLLSLVGTATERSKKARVSGDLKKLEAAIESYKAKIGVYPPDNVRANKDVRFSPLYYELLGTTNDTSGIYRIPATGDKIDRPTLQSALGTDGIVNSQPLAEDVKTFLVGVAPNQHAKVSSRGGDIELFVVPVEGPNDFTVGTSRINPWRYNSSNPTNNPNSYDLWAEIVIRGKTNIIGNWKE